MKSISTFAKECCVNEAVSRINKINGSRYVKCESKELGISYDIKSSKWFAAVFELRNSFYVGYFTKEDRVIFYHEIAKDNWSSVTVPEDTEIVENMFEDFESVLKDNATVPIFDVFDTNIGIL